MQIVFPTADLHKMSNIIFSHKISKNVVYHNFELALKGLIVVCTGAYIYLFDL